MKNNSNADNQNFHFLDNLVFNKQNISNSFQNLYNKGRIQSEGDLYLQVMEILKIDSTTQLTCDEILEKQMIITNAFSYIETINIEETTRMISVFPKLEELITELKGYHQQYKNNVKQNQQIENLQNNQILLKEQIKLDQIGKKQNQYDEQISLLSESALKSFDTLIKQMKDNYKGVKSAGDEWLKSQGKEPETATLDDFIVFNQKSAKTKQYNSNSTQVQMEPLTTEDYQNNSNFNKSQRVEFNTSNFTTQKNPGVRPQDNESYQNNEKILKQDEMSHAFIKQNFSNESIKADQQQIDSNFQDNKTFQVDQYSHDTIGELESKNNASQTIEVNHYGDWQTNNASFQNESNSMNQLNESRKIEKKNKSEAAIRSKNNNYQGESNQILNNTETENVERSEASIRTKNSPRQNKMRDDQTSITSTNNSQIERSETAIKSTQTPTIVDNSQNQQSMDKSNQTNNNDQSKYLKYFEKSNISVTEQQQPQLNNNSETTGHVNFRIQHKFTSISYRKQKLNNQLTQQHENKKSKKMIVKVIKVESTVPKDEKPIKKQNFKVKSLLSKNKKSKQVATQSYSDPLVESLSEKFQELKKFMQNKQELYYVKPNLQEIQTLLNRKNSEQCLKQII